MLCWQRFEHCLFAVSQRAAWESHARDLGEVGPWTSKTQPRDGSIAVPPLSRRRSKRLTLLKLPDESNGSISRKGTALSCRATALPTFFCTSPLCVRTALASLMREPASSARRCAG